MMAEIKRERWTSRSSFIFAAIGSAIGLGNVWRFPYLTYEHGGGVFLIPYIIALFIFGIPWMIVELGMGRYLQRSAPGIFESIGKKWEWLGWWPVWVAFLIGTYYTVVIAWSLRYVIASATVAWGTGKAGAKGAASYFFEQVLRLSEGPTILGAPVWPILGLLAIVWVILFFIMFRGAPVIGKVSSWLITLAWVLLVVLLIRGLTLPGAVKGLNYYLTPNLAELGNAEVWFAAFSQIAFTLSLGAAVMFAYGSFIARKADVNNSAFITSFSNCTTSFFAGFAVFSIVGFVMQACNIPIGEVAVSGLGLSFITYPVAVSMLPGANALVGMLFFLCLFFLGLTSAYSLAYTCVISLMDKFGLSRVKTTIAVCVAAFLGGIPFTTSGGLYWLDMVDRAVSFYGMLIGGTLASLVVGWVFGAQKLREHVNETSDIKLGIWWEWMVKLIVPLALLFVVIYGGFRFDITKPYEGYQVGVLNGSQIIWLILVIILILSFVLQGMKTKGPKEKNK